MPSNTTNLRLKINHQNEDTTFREWRGDIDSKFETIDGAYGKITEDIETAINSTDEWDQRVIDISTENSNIYNEINKKVSAVPGSSLVSDELIQKLDDDYTKSEIDSNFVTKEQLANTTIKQEDINLNNYYTKAEVNGIVTGGFGAKISQFFSVSNVKVLNKGFSSDIPNRFTSSELLKTNRLFPEQVVEDIIEIWRSL